MKDKIKKFLKENYKFIIFTIILAISLNIKLPYYVLAPGGIIDITSRVSYDNKKVEKGSLNMLYVSEYELTPAIYLYSKVLKWDVFKNETRKINNETIEETKERNKIMRDNSLDIAKIVAYRKAGKEVNITKTSNIVIARTNSSFRVGDIVTKVDDIKCENVSSIKKIINNHNVDDDIKFTVIRNNKEIEINTKVYEEEKSKVVGIIVLNDLEYELNPNIDITFKDKESGSSGGLMLTLTIYNAISDIDIIKGRNIAGTGTISLDGSVGEIDGIKYKLIGAHKNNMDIVLVPSANYEEAINFSKKNNYKMQIVKVDKIEDAINYLTK